MNLVAAKTEATKAVAGPHLSAAEAKAAVAYGIALGLIKSAPAIDPDHPDNPAMRASLAAKEAELRRKLDGYST